MRDELQKFRKLLGWVGGVVVGALLATAADGIAQGTLSDQVLRLLSRDNTWSGQNVIRATKGLTLESSGTAPSPATNKLYNIGGNLFFNGTLVGVGSGGGSGTVTSVALTMPGIFTVTNSPVVSSGVLLVTLATEPANYVWAGPTGGVAAAPAFRALVDDDVPNDVTVAGTNNVTWGSLNKSGSSLADLATKSASDLTSGTLPDARFPATLPAAAGGNLTALNATNLASGTVAAARMPALTGDVTTAVGAVATTLAASGVTAGSYTLASITVDAKGRVTSAANGSGAGTGTVTNVTGSLTANQLVLGNGTVDAKPLGTLGTATTVYHGNVGGAGTFGAVSLTADVSGVLPRANGGTGLAFLGFAGPTVGRIWTGPDADATLLTTNATVTVGQGGTGLVAPGASGNVLTSNGTAWVSSALVFATSSIGAATASSLTISGLAGSGTRCLQVDNGGVVGINASACGAGGGGSGDAFVADPLSQFASTTSAQLRSVLSDETGTGIAYFVGGALGTPASGTLTNATGLPVATGISGLGTGVGTWLASPSSANLLAAITDETGTGAAVFANTPTLVTPILGTPTSVTLTNGTGLPVATGISGLASGIATFLATPTSANLIAALTNETGTGAAVFATSPVLVTPALGTPSSGVATNLTGLPISTGVSGLGSGVATALATPTSANFAAMISDETGSGAAVFAVSPSLTTPVLGVASGTSITLSSLAGSGTRCVSVSNAGLLGLASAACGAGGGDALVANPLSQFASTTSAQLRGVLSDEVGTGAAYFVGGALGTPASATLTNATGLPVASGISGLGTGVAAWLAAPTAANLGTALGSQAANYVFASPDGTVGNGSFRALTSNDFPQTIHDNAITSCPQTIAVYGASYEITSAGSCTINLPTVSGHSGATIAVTNLGAGVVTLDGAGSETIISRQGGVSTGGGPATTLGIAQYGSVNLQVNTAATAWVKRSGE